MALVAWVLRQDLEPASPVVVLVDAISVSGGGAQNLQPQVCLLPLGLPEMLGHPLPISFRPFPGVAEKHRITNPPPAGAQGPPLASVPGIQGGALVPPGGYDRPVQAHGCLRFRVIRTVLAGTLWA